MSWVEAIKKYSEVTGEKFAIPKRESPEYAKIKAIQDKMAKGETIEKLPKPKKEKKPKPVAPEPVAPTPAPAPTPTPVVKKEKIEKPVAPLPSSEPVQQTIAIESKKIKKRQIKTKTPEQPVVNISETAPAMVAKEQKQPKQKKEPKIDNKVKIVELPTVVEKEVKQEKLSPKEEREAKQKAKQERLEAQAIKAGQHALQHARVVMKNGPFVIDFS